MKKKHILVSSALVVALIAGLAFPVSNNGLQNVEAASRMYGVQQIINTMDEDDPFVILEVVPDEAYSSLGYYVADSEPTISAKLMKDTVNTDADVSEEACTTQATRKEKIEHYLGTIASETGPVSYDSSFYMEQIFAPDSMDGWEEIKAPDGEFFYEYRVGYYELAETHYIEQGKYKRVQSTEIAEDGTETVVISYEYSPEEGTYIWIDDESSENSKKELVQFDSLYYYTSLRSNDWFAKDVLETTSSRNISVISLTASQLEEKLIEGDISKGNLAIDVTLNEVDLVYLSNSACLNYGADDYVLLDTYAVNTAGSVVGENDISWETAYSIYEYVINTRLPVIVDDTIISNVVSSELSISSLLKADNNIIRLAYLLENYTTKTTLEDYALTTDSSVWTDELIAELVAATSIKNVGTAGSVDGSIYVITTGQSLVNTTWKNTEIYNSSVVSDTNINDVINGMSEVVSEIEKENFYNDAQGGDRTVEYDENDVVHVSQSTLVKYILNYGYRRVVLAKDTITVLDVEPTKYSTLTEDVVKGWIRNTEAEEMIKEINIVQTSTYEFIGKLDDLNEKYDLIYFGSCVGKQGLAGSLNLDSDGETVYNDSKMNHLIYTNVGDTVVANAKFAGLFDADYETVTDHWGNTSKVLKKGISTQTRYSGNDITEDKMKDLMEFVEAGFPVVVSEKFFLDDDQVNTKYIDDSSKMYQFLNTYAGKKANLINEGLIDEDDFDKDVLVDYINMPKLYLSLISAPTEYTVVYDEADENKIESVTYLKSVDGKYNLDYVFEFTDSAGSINDSTTYKVQLFVDTNADGQYGALEELDGLIVTEENNKNEVAANCLQSGVRYHVRRELPSDYTGIISWKLVISRVEVGRTEVDSSIKASAKGYSAIEVDKKNLTEVNVLQIESDEFVGDALELDNNATFAQLFSDMKTFMGYDISVKGRRVSEYLKDYDDFIPDSKNPDPKVTQFYEAYFQEFDMIIIGFSDCFSDIDSEEATQAIKLFIESGRSVLFSHDTTSHMNANKKAFDNANSNYYRYWGYQLNQYVRSLVGMDRYGITDFPLFRAGQSLDLVNNKETDDVKSYLNFMQTSGKDEAYIPNSSRGETAAKVQGYNDVTIDLSDNRGSGNTYYSVEYGNVENHWGTSKKTIELADTRVSNITQVNEGQITSYPHDLNIVPANDNNCVSESGYSMIKYGREQVMETHCQYYQLDMELDKNNDGESDMVVWYCLADDAYEAKPNDVRNNYYIYSVGNVTYTGMGHLGGGNGSARDIKGYEAKLFVNTIIASFNSGVRNPSISIIADEKNKGTSLECIYRTFDEEVGNVDTTDETIYFYVNDSNIINGTKVIDVKYYYPVDEVTDKSFVNSEGETIYLKELTAITCADGTIESNEIYSAKIASEWINAQLSQEGVNEVTIYLSAQTTLDYYYERPEEKTDEVFTSITLKKRDLFNLD